MSHRDVPFDRWLRPRAIHAARQAASTLSVRYSEDPFFCKISAEPHLITVRRSSNTICVFSLYGAGITRDVVRQCRRAMRYT